MIGRSVPATDLSQNVGLDDGIGQGGGDPDMVKPPTLVGRGPIL